MGKEESSLCMMHIFFAESGLGHIHGERDREREKERDRERERERERDTHAYMRTNICLLNDLKPKTEPKTHTKLKITRGASPLESRVIYVCICALI